MLTRRSFSVLLPGAALLKGAVNGRVRDGLERLIEARQITGAVTMVVTRSGVTHLLAQGYADAEGKTVLKKDALFSIASMSKPVTGAAVMMLQDAGKLRVEDAVAKYIPELKGLQGVTIQHLMTHTSGMGEATNEESAAAKTLADLIPAFASKPLGFAPGSQWKYCQSGINTLCRIVEVVSGLPFGEFLQQRLFAGLGMKNTTFYPSERQLAKWVQPCEIVEGRLTPSKQERFTREWALRKDRPPLGNGGLYSTAEDYGEFARMLLQEGESRGKRFLTAAAVQQMTAVHTGELKAGFIPGSAWGLTVGIVREPQGASATLSKGTFGHGGAWGTQAWMDPVKGVGLILMIARVGLKNADASDMRIAFQEGAMALSQ